ncbi:MAG: glutamate-1-semialdehyde 2,1-aminomutase, partial [Anaerolineaceae bacterium]|nr:glutamate-1-semialdehyde 2,1-aminomutase [Anaerolineaceae bacterium]
LEFFKEAQKYFAGGVGSGTRSPGNGWQPGPLYVTRGEGSHFWDVDENEYIDYLLACGPLILGHRPKPVIDLVCQTIQERGSIFSMAHDLEIQAAKEICELIPSIEQVRFDNSGTAAVQRAFRLARAYTGKTKIVRFEGHYHGWSDQIHWSNHFPLEVAGRRNAPRPIPNSNGIPEILSETLIVLPWNDIDLLEKTIRAHKDEIACVITEPILGNTGGIMPLPGYLEAMRQLTAEHEIVLIFDEVLTGFRVALGGAQNLFNIQPDLTTLAKSVAAGFPVAAIGGRRDIMDLVSNGEIMFGGTYNSNPIATSAVVATLQELKKPGVYERMTMQGEKLANGLVDLAQRAGFKATWSGVGPLFQLWFCDANELPRDYRETIPIVKSSPFRRFWEHMIAQGIIIQPNQDNLFLMCTEHSDQEIETTLQAAETAFAKMR